MGKYVNEKWFGPSIFIFDSKGIFYGYFQSNIPTEGTLIIDDVRYVGTFKENGQFKKGIFNYNNKIYVHYDSNKQKIE